MLKYLFLFFGICILFTSCGSKSGGPAKLNIDGKEIKIQKSFGIHLKGRGYMIVSQNHSQSNCQDMLKSMRRIRSGEVTFRVFHNSKGGMNRVSLGSHTYLGADTTLKKKPSKIGDTMEIALDEVEFKPVIGDHKGKKVVASGTFKAEYCGEK